MQPPASGPEIFLSGRVRESTWYRFTADWLIFGHHFSLLRGHLFKVILKGRPKFLPSYFCGTLIFFVQVIALLQKFSAVFLLQRNIRVRQMKEL